MKRTYISELQKEIGKNVEVFGWVHSRRDHGKIIFFDLRDSTGLLQVVSTPKNEESYKIASSLTSEDVIKVSGSLKERPESNVNKDIETGNLELNAENIEIIGKAKELPLPIDTDGSEIDEAVRLKYRYLDLRRERLQRNLSTRHKIVTAIREFLNGQKFLEIETPYMSKTTPEGARDFLVPSRLQKGKFYALTQAPQQYKQLLMLAGVDRYYQIARAFRDEDLRADRQLEHTQIDMEMAFVSREDILDLVEEMLINVAEKLGKKITEKPFPRYAHKEAQEKFGADKFDIRKNKEDKDELGFAFVIDYPLLEKDEETNKWTFSHNPFTSPKEEDKEKLMKMEDLGSISSLQYDVVCNGFEFGSGSIRIHEPELQKKVFEVMGYTPEQIKEDFSHILEAYEYGAPVHGGIAMGIDRIAAVFSGESSIREVVAFPVNSSGQTAVMDAPTEVSENILKELGIKKLAKE